MNNFLACDVSIFASSSSVHVGDQKGLRCAAGAVVREIREIRIRPRLRHCKCCPCDALRQPRSPVWLNVLVSPGSAYKYYLRREAPADRISPLSLWVPTGPPGRRHVRARKRHFRWFPRIPATSSGN